MSVFDIFGTYATIAKVGALVVAVGAVYAYGHSNGADSQKLTDDKAYSSLKGEYDQYKLNTKDTFLNIANLTQKAYEETLRNQNLFNSTLSTLGAQVQTLKDKNRDQDSKLRNLNDSGNLRMRVQAICPAAANAQPGANVPGVQQAGSVGDAATVELGPDARRNVLDIRTGINDREVIIKYLQGYISRLEDAQNKPASAAAK